jgi:hypothetical protein
VFVVGFAVGREAAPIPRVEPPSCPDVDVRAVIPAVRAAVAAELARVPRPPEPATPPPDPAPPPPALPTDTEIAAEDEATRLIDGGRTRGQWDDADGARLRSLLGSMSAPQRRAVMTRLVQAVNAQELSLGHASLL